MQRILGIMDRVMHGPHCTVKEWDAKVVPSKTRLKLKQYDLSGACDRDNPITWDDELVDRFYQAGFELAHEMGMLCQDSERIIEVSEEELRQALSNAPARIDLGRGADRVSLAPRRPEDPTPPLYSCPMAIAVSEEVWIPMVTGLAMNRVVDILECPSLVTIFGRQVLAGTPLETLMGRVEVQWRNEALWRAGRPGMPTVGIGGSTTHHGQLGGFNLKGLETDVALVLSPFELKTSYGALHKMVQAKNSGAIIRAGTPSMIGGYAGPPEGAVVTNIASTLLQFVIHQADYAAGGMMDLRYNGNTGRDGLWAASTSTQALSRNTNVILSKFPETVAGPMTEMFLYETAAGLIQTCVTGASVTTAPRSAGGDKKDHMTPLEAWYGAEVFKAAAGMSREQANDIIKWLIPKYEDQLMNPPKGQTFQELFDVDSLTPIPEWLEMVRKVQREIVGMGVPLEL